MSSPPVLSVTPGYVVVWKCRVRPRIPRIYMDAGHIDHPPAVDDRHRIDVGHSARAVRIESLDQRLQIAPLHEIIALAIREMRQRGFGALGINEHIRLVRALVDRRAPNLHEPDGLRLRNPSRG